MAAYQRVISLNPMLVEAHIGVAELRMAEQNYSQATIAYRRVIQLLPESAPAHFNLGLALAQQGRSSEAIEAVEAALRLYRAQADQDGTQKAEALLKTLRN